MRFQEQPVIFTTTIYRVARVSSTMGDRVVEQLRDAGQIDPIKTPAGRQIVTPPDGAAIYDALVDGQ